MCLYENVICDSFVLFLFFCLFFLYVKEENKVCCGCFICRLLFFLWDWKFIWSVLGGIDVFGELGCFNEMLLEYRYF